jgi:chemotaxis protein methyltransferase CheR
MELSSSEFEGLKTFILKVSGIHIPTEKHYLIESRLAPIVAQYGFASYSTLYSALMENRDRSLENSVISAITTNETSFFRDSKPFEVIADWVLPRIMDASKGQDRKARILSAASSTGQEPYSLAMLITEWCEKPGNHALKNEYEIIAVDISTKAVEKAKQGRYSQNEVSRGLDSHRLSRFFSLDEKSYVVKDELRSKVTFKCANIVHSLQMLGRFDLVLLRNVLIYFNDATKSEILENIHRILHVDAYFLQGATEAVFDLHTGYEQLHKVHKALYKRV